MFVSETLTTHDDLAAMLTAEGDTVVERLDRWARQTPDRTFLYYGETDREYSFTEFGSWTDVLAGNLHRIGIAKGDRVSVLSANSLLCAAMMFAAWKIGAVYAPVNYSFRGRLLAYQIDDTAARLLVTDTTLIAAVNEIADQVSHHPVVAVYDPMADVAPKVLAPFTPLDWAELNRPCPRPRVDLAFDDPASVFYTSGTTGPAKGVVLPHRWLASYTFYHRMLLSPEDVIYCDLPLYHVGGAISLVSRAAWVGCEVAVWDRFSPNEFWSRIAFRGASVAALLDVMIPWLLKVPPRDDDTANTLNKVNMQPLPARHQEFARRFGIDVVSTGFGQTESGCPIGLIIEETPQGGGTPAHLYRGLSHAEILARAAKAGIATISGGAVARKGMMGRPVPFMEVAILDERDQPCPVGVPGQLAVRPRVPGVLFTEYLGKAPATVSAWRNLWFHTGDAAVLASDGMYDYVDRLGDRIRVRGENLTSSQVEDLLNQHPHVRMTAVFGIASAEGDEDDICAFVVPLAGAGVSAEDLHTFAVQTMPKFMRPKHIRVVSDVPRTPTNKIEKYKLRQMILADVTGAPPG
ncbi:ATP-dependent acyl-CoA ligase [Mycolicibacterium sp. 018/SC-01/001]|uniref:class I adenylate-forming enzyme family protein n=1 Tax=Mycolicibacterium sp. 018/SC-01/001 TaxID=2592069 RepID=UPI00117F547C|nr:AMP-binding protein [Mycolicibacterium sp. 018/SC-01/001]TRW80289.1 ATP-dependent acyl-CoA ligase [Mycolicibacterium sp. 018/SC-01/001]